MRGIERPPRASSTRRGEQLALVVVDRGQVRRHDRGEQRDTVRRARGRQIGALERDPSRRHVPAGVSDDQLGEQHQGPPDRCSVPLMLPDAAGPAHTGPAATRLGACPATRRVPFDAQAYEHRVRADAERRRVLHLLHRRRRAGRSSRAVPGRPLHRVPRQVADAARLLAPRAARPSHGCGRKLQRERVRRAPAPGSSPGARGRRRASRPSAST